MGNPKTRANKLLREFLNSPLMSTEVCERGTFETSPEVVKALTDILSEDTREYRHVALTKSGQHVYLKKLW